VSINIHSENCPNFPSFFFIIFFAYVFDGYRIVSKISMLPTNLSCFRHNYSTNYIKYPAQTKTKKVLPIKVTKLVICYFNDRICILCHFKW
jgi:hypothetical protein